MSTTPSPCHTDQDKWFSVDPKNLERCLELCRTACPMRQACLELALAAGETGPESGIWGGELPETRARMLAEAEAEAAAEARALEETPPATTGAAKPERRLVIAA